MSDKKKKLHLATRAIHAGSVPEDGTGSVTTPIYPSSTFRMAFPGDESGYVYSRWSNPTRAALERAFATIENGTHGYAFSSGLSALNAVLHLLRSGDHIISVNDLYGGTMRQFEQVMRQMGLSFSYVNGEDPADFEKEITDKTRLIWIESPTNPLLKLMDIEAIAKIAHSREILLAVDNTFATPVIQRPLELGADIVHHSVSKYLGGHADVIGGALVVRDEKLAERIHFVQNAVGGTLGPFESWLVLRGLKTLDVRVTRGCENAVRVAEYLNQNEMVARVYYPGQDGKPLPNGMSMPGAMVSFDLRADFETVKSFITATELFVLAESLGGVESLINHPASMTHASIPKELREANGVFDSLVRLSVGIEHIDDLIADLTQAFNSVRALVEKS